MGDEVGMKKDTWAIRVMMGWESRALRKRKFKVSFYEYSGFVSHTQKSRPAERYISISHLLSHKSYFWYYLSRW